MNTEYYIAGTITNKSSLVYDDLCINLILKDSENNEYSYLVMYGKAIDTKILFQNNITAEDFAKRTDITVKNVYLRNTYDGDDMEIFSYEHLTIFNMKIYAPLYICLFFSVLLIIGLLVVAALYSKYKTNLHSVSMSISTKTIRKRENITCKYCGYTTNQIMDKCPKCGSNILKL